MSRWNRGRMAQYTSGVAGEWQCPGGVGGEWYSIWVG
jgi:hypothetical protein